MKKLILSLIIGFLMIFSDVWAKEIKVSNEMIYEKLLEIERRQIVLETQFKEFKEATNKRFDEQMKFLEILAGIFTALVLGVIGFAIWDRKTIIKRAKEEAIEEIEKEGNLRDLIRALRELARKNKELAEVLRRFNLM